MKLVQGLAKPKPLNEINNALTVEFKKTQVRVTMYYIDERDQVEGSRTCLGI
jgi:hypothetical protein